VAAPSVTQKAPRDGSRVMSVLDLRRRPVATPHGARSVAVAG
jgi:hypothetical protein